MVFRLLPHSARSASSPAASTLRTFVCEDRHRGFLDELVLAIHETLNEPKGMEAILRRELPTLLKLYLTDAAQKQSGTDHRKIHIHLIKRSGGGRETGFKPSPPQSTAGWVL
jgi:hypothetical protein